MFYLIIPASLIPPLPSVVLSISFCVMFFFFLSVFLFSLCSAVGRGPDPPDSGWLNMDRQHPKKPGQREPMGKLCVSIEIFPSDTAKMNPAGSGRRAPNKNPRCPPPTGRLKWSWNPFVMGAQLCGPKICCYITCFLLTGVFIVLMIYCQPFANIILWILVNIFVPGR